MASVKDLNNIKNIAPRVKKTTGERRRTVSVNDEVGEQLAAADTPDAVGKLARDHGISLDELMDRAKKAPNFGQFRMVLGNRIRGIRRRMEADSSLSFNDAANPKRRAKPSGKKKTSKKTAGKKKTKKKVGKKSPKTVSGGDIKAVHHLDTAMTEDEAKTFAKSFSSTLEFVKEFGTESAAIKHARKIGSEDHLVITGEDDNAGRFLVVCMKVKSPTGRKFATKKTVKKG